jgi:hypothetical protein
MPIHGRTTDATSVDSRPADFWPAYFRYGVPCGAVWVVYLLAFWPGILTEDSIEQWTDMTSGVLRGYHSPLQTSLHWLLTRLWYSPAIIVIAQIAALSAAWAMVAAECAARNAPRWLLAATTLLVAALPANGFLVVTLWKDVPYSIALLWITALTLRLARSRGRFVGRLDVPIMAMALTAAATFRHNGLPTVALFLLLLIRAVPAPRRPAWHVAALTLAGVLAIHFGLFRVLGVQPYHPAYRDQTILHQIAAAMRTGTAYTQDDFTALGRIMPLANWVHDYRCQSVIPTLVSVLAHSPEEEYARLRPSLRTAWWHAVTRSPWNIIGHHACVSGLIWNPAASYALVSTGIVNNGHGLQARPVVPSINRVLSAVLGWSSGQPWRALLWDPAAHLLVVACGVVWASLRRADRLTVLALALPLLHTGILLVAIPSAEYRLQYPVVLGSLVSPLIVASAGMWSTRDAARSRG